MKRDRKVLEIDLYGCSGIERTKNKVSDNNLHFTPLLVGEKQGGNSNNFSKVYVFNYIKYFKLILVFNSLSYYSK